MGLFVVLILTKVVCVCVCLFVFVCLFCVCFFFGWGENCKPWDQWVACLCIGENYHPWGLFVLFVRINKLQFTGLFFGESYLPCFVLPGDIKPIHGLIVCVFWLLMSVRFVR